MNARDSYDQVALGFRGDRPLREVMTEVLAACGRLGLEGAVQARANVILEELLVNIFEHGSLGPDGIVRLVLRRVADALHVELTDTGRPFDLREASREAATPDRGGGAGLRIVREWADIQRYEAGPPLNRLVLSIPIVLPSRA